MENQHGNVNIYNSVEVYAYGGAGGSGGSSDQSGSGSGGYPGAGIGGGGAGGAGSTCCTGAGGYSGGTGRNTKLIAQAENGLNGGVFFDSRSAVEACTWGSGGGYYKGSLSVTQNSDLTTKYGGMSGSSWWTGHLAGDGGVAGSGGDVKVAGTAKIYAFNGNRYTDGTEYNNGENEAVIYFQNGINIERGYTSKSKEGGMTDSESYAIFHKTNDQSAVAKTGYINHYFDDKSASIKRVTINDLLINVELSNQGIGSGAGYIELSNGTYKVDESMN